MPKPGFPTAASLLTVHRLELLLADQHCALVHAPFPGDANFSPLFPDARSLFLRRAFAVGGMDAEFASRHDVPLLIDRLRHRFDDHLLQNQITAVTRTLEQQLDEVKAVKEKLLPAPDHLIARRRRVRDRGEAAHGRRQCSAGSRGTAGRHRGGAEAARRRNTRRGRLHDRRRAAVGLAGNGGPYRN